MPILHENNKLNMKQNHHRKSSKPLKQGKLLQMIVTPVLYKLLPLYVYHNWKKKVFKEPDSAFHVLWLVIFVNWKSLKIMHLIFSLVYKI